MTVAKSIDVVVITPERQVLAETAGAVVIPAHDGELGVLRDRAALMCELGIGQLRYAKDGRTQRVFVDGGFAQVYDNHVTVLTNRALPAEDVTADTIAAAERSVDELQGHEPHVLAERERAQRRLGVLRKLQSAG